MTDYNAANPLEGATTCPHCGGLAKTSKHPTYGQICNICGAPRIEAKGVELSGRERGPLEKARAAKRDRLLWRIGAVVGGSSSAFIMLVAFIATLIASSAAWALGGVVFALPWAILAFVGFAKAKHSSEELQRALVEARKSAARDIVFANPDGVTAADIGARMDLDADMADQIAAELSVGSEVRSRITDEGQMVLTPAAGMRFEESSGASVADPLEEKFAALEQAEREAAAAEESPAARKHHEDPNR